MLCPNFSQIRQANPPHLGFFVLLEEKQLAFLLGGGELEHVAFVMSQKRLGPYYLSLVSHLGCAAEAGFLPFYGGGYTTFDASGQGLFCLESWVAV